MNVLRNLWTVLTALATFGGAFAFLYSIINFIKGSNMKATLKNPYKKMAIYSFLFTCIVAFLFYVFGGFEHSKIDNAKHPQTENKIKKSVLFAPVKTKLDTPYNKPFVTRRKRYNPVIPKVDTSKNSNKVDNSVTVKGDDNHIVGGSGNSVGVNGDQYNGVNQRQLNKAYKKIILDVIPDNKKDTIIIRFNTDKESRTFMDEIAKYLRGKGYEHVIPLVDLGLYGDDDLIAKPFAGKYFIFVYPESNVNQ